MDPSPPIVVVAHQYRKCCCNWEANQCKDCYEQLQLLLPLEDVWRGAPMEIDRRNPSVKHQLMVDVLQNLFGLDRNKELPKRYYVARHHFPRSLLELNQKATKKSGRFNVRNITTPINLQEVEWVSQQEPECGQALHQDMFNCNTILKRLARAISQGSWDDVRNKYVQAPVVSYSMVQAKIKMLKDQQTSLQPWQEQIVQARLMEKQRQSKRISARQKRQRQQEDYIATKKCDCNWNNCRELNYQLQLLLPSEDVWKGLAFEIDRSRATYSEKHLALISVVQEVLGIDPAIGTPKRYHIARHHFPRALLEQNNGVVNHQRGCSARKLVRKITTPVSSIELNQIVHQEQCQTLNNERYRLDVILKRLGRRQEGDTTVLTADDTFVPYFVQAPVVQQQYVKKVAASLLAAADEATRSKVKERMATWKNSQLDCGNNPLEETMAATKAFASVASVASCMQPSFESAICRKRKRTHKGNSDDDSDDDSKASANCRLNGGDGTVGANDSAIDRAPPSPKSLNQSGQDVEAEDESSKSPSLRHADWENDQIEALLDDASPLKYASPSVPTGSEDAALESPQSCYNDALDADDDKRDEENKKRVFSPIYQALPSLLLNTPPQAKSHPKRCCCNWSDCKDMSLKLQQLLPPEDVWLGPMFVIDRRNHTIKHVSFCYTLERYFLLPSNQILPRHYAVARHHFSRALLQKNREGYRKRSIAPRNIVTPIALMEVDSICRLEQSNALKDEKNKIKTILSILGHFTHATDIKQMDILDKYVQAPIVSHDTVRQKIIELDMPSEPPTAQYPAIQSNDSPSGGSSCLGSFSYLASSSPLRKPSFIGSPSPDCNPFYIRSPSPSGTPCFESPIETTRVWNPRDQTECPTLVPARGLEPVGRRSSSPPLIPSVDTLIDYLRKKYSVLFSTTGGSENTAMRAMQQLLDSKSSNCRDAVYLLKHYHKYLFPIPLSRTWYLYSCPGASCHCIAYTLKLSDKLVLPRCSACEYWNCRGKGNIKHS